MDAIFKALADPTRRGLLDELFRRDGQTLTELGRRRDMTRFGVMKHLRILEDAGLVVTRKQGREKLHFLNAVPIRRVHDRWIDKYREAWTTMLTELKDSVESDTEERVFEIYIKTTPERLWQAITDPAMRRKYTFGVAVFTDWKQGSHYEGIPEQFPGMKVIEGENVEVDPPRRLVQTFRAALERCGQGRGHVACHLGNRTGRRFLPPPRHPRPPAPRRQQRDLWWLADGPLRPQDVAGDRRAAHHARLDALEPEAVTTKKGSQADSACDPPSRRSRSARGYLRSSCSTTYRTRSALDLRPIFSSSRAR